MRLTLRWGRDKCDVWVLSRVRGLKFLVETLNTLLLRYDVDSRKLTKIRRDFTTRYQKKYFLWLLITSHSMFRSYFINININICKTFMCYNYDTSNYVGKLLLMLRIINNIIRLQIQKTTKDNSL